MHNSFSVFLSHIPTVIWVFCAVLLLGFLWQLFAMQLSRNRLRKHIGTLIRTLREQVEGSQPDPRYGLTLEQLDTYRVALGVC